MADERVNMRIANQRDLYARGKREYRKALLRIAATGCERLTAPSECRAPNGYPEPEWCYPCIAAAALGLPLERPKDA
jgi:hypothetical protein